MSLRDFWEAEPGSGRVKGATGSGWVAGSGGVAGSGWSSGSGWSPGSGLESRIRLPGRRAPLPFRGARSPEGFAKPEQDCADALCLNRDQV